MTEYRCPSEIELERKIESQERVFNAKKEDEDWLMFEGIGNALTNL